MVQDESFEKLIKCSTAKKKQSSTAQYHYSQCGDILQKTVYHLKVDHFISRGPQPGKSKDEKGHLTL